MAVSPSNTISLAIDALRESLSQSATWLTVCDDVHGTPEAPLTQADVKDRVYRHALPEPADGKEYTLTEQAAYRPFGIVACEAPAGFRLNRATSDQFVASGRMGLILVRSIPSGLTDADADLEWENAIGGICDDLCDNSLTAGSLFVRRVEIADGPGRAPIETEQGQGEEQGVRLSIIWGVEA